MKDHIQKVLLLYTGAKRKELQLADDYPALVIFDNFKVQCTFEILKMLDDNQIYVVLIPPNCTNRLQPLDLSVNKPEKDILYNKFQTWYMQRV